MYKKKYILLMLCVALLIFPQTSSGAESKQFLDTAITAVQWSNNELYIAYGYGDGKIEVVDALTSSLVHTFNNHSDSVITLSWREDDILLASASVDRSAKVWNMNTGSLVSDLVGSSEFTNGIAWMAAGSQLAVSSPEDRVSSLRIWDISTEMEISSYSLGAISLIDMGLDSGTVMLTSADTITLHDSITMSRIGNPLIIGSGPNTLERWKNYMISMETYPAYDRFVLGTFGGYVYLGRISTLEILASVRISQYDPDLGPREATITSLITDVHYLADDSEFVALSSDGNLKRWNENGEELLSYQLTDTPIRAADFNNAGTELAYGGDDGLIRRVFVNP